MKPISPFRCKQFTVRQSRNVMAVGTDSMLLGSWVDTSGAKRILDIGTGTGLLALMLAQACSHADVDAIDSSSAACELAAENFTNSPWSNRMRLYHTALQHFMPDVLYDVIVSNPPYFTNDLLGPEGSRNAARHQLTLTYNELLFGISRLLHKNGKAFIAIPYRNYKIFMQEACSFNLHVSGVVYVQAREETPPYLTLIQLSASPQQAEISSITIMSNEGDYTDAFKTMTAAYYERF